MKSLLLYLNLLYFDELTSIETDTFVLEVLRKL